MRNPNRILQIIGTAATGAGLAYAPLMKKANNDSKVIRKENDNRNQDIDQKLEEIKDLVKSNESKIENLDNKVDTLPINVKTLSKSQNFIQDFNISSIKDLFNELFEFFINFDLLSQALIFNIFCSSLLFSLLSSFLIGKYSNYLIEKFKLNIRYPKLHKFLILRTKLQEYYFKYLIIMGYLVLIYNLSINIYALINI